MEWLRRIFFGRKRCEIQGCWLDATKRHKGHALCDTHHHEYTYDTAISGKTL